MTHEEVVEPVAIFGDCALDPQAYLLNIKRRTFSEAVAMAEALHAKREYVSLSLRMVWRAVWEGELQLSVFEPDRLDPEFTWDIWQLEPDLPWSTIGATDLWHLSQVRAWWYGLPSVLDHFTL